MTSWATSPAVAKQRSVNSCPPITTPPHARGPESDSEPRPKGAVLFTHRPLFSMVLFALLLGHLAAKQPPQAPVNINTASAQELAQLPGIGPARAAQIVRLREKNGPFRSVEELRSLPRLSEKQFQQIKKYATVREGSAAGGGAKH